MEGHYREALCNIQVLLAWGLEHGTSVIPKTTKVKNLKSNLDVLNWNLPSEDFKALSDITPQAKDFLISTCICANCNSQSASCFQMLKPGCTHSARCARKVCTAALQISMRPWGGHSLDTDKILAACRSAWWTAISSWTRRDPTRH